MFVNIRQVRDSYFFFFFLLLVVPVQLDFCIVLLLFFNPSFPPAGFVLCEVDADVVDVSSTEVRRRMMEGLDYSELVLPSVLAYLVAHPEVTITSTK